MHPEVTHSLVSLPSNTKTLFQVWFVQKMTGSSEDMGNRNTEALLMEMELGKLVASPKKLKIELPHDPATPPWVYIQKN